MNLTHQPTPVGLKGFVSMMAKTSTTLFSATMATLIRLHGRQRHNKPTTQADNPDEQAKLQQVDPSSVRGQYYTTRATLQPTNRLTTHRLFRKRRHHDISAASKEKSLPKKFSYASHSLLTSSSQGSILLKNEYGRQTNHDNHSYLHLYQQQSPPDTKYKD